MSQEQKPENSNQSDKPELDREIVKAIIEQQNKRLQLEEKRIQFEEKKLEHNTKLAEQTMQHQSVFLKDAPKNKRYLILTQAGVGITILIIILLFIGYCLYIGKDEIVNKLLILFTHTATLLIGLFIGKRLKRKEDEIDPNDQDDFVEAEIVS